MSWKPSDIKWVDWEISSFCNAGCLDCNRWIWNPETDEMNLNSLNEHINKFMSVEAFERRVKKFEPLRYILFQGNVGDPMTHPHIAELVDIAFKHHPDIRMDINTNGSVGSLKAWKKLCEHADKNIVIMFSIDGLEDTNHIYRRGCDWDKIMRNAQMWIDAGGEAEWAMIDFPYNAHQRQEAERISKEMGFEDFRVRQRTSPEKEFDDWIVSKSKQPVIQKMIDLNHLPKVDELRQEYKKNKEEYAGLPIKPACTFTEVEGDDHWPNFHVNVEGTIWPCCFTSNLPYLQEYDSRLWREKDKKYSAKHGANWNNLDHRSLQEILDTDWFSKDLPESWHLDNDDDSLMVCKRNCCDRGYVWNDDLGKRLDQMSKETKK